MNPEIIASFMMLSYDEKNILVCKDINTGAYFLPGTEVRLGIGIEKSLNNYFQKTGIDVKNRHFLGVIENIFKQKGKIRHQYMYIFKIVDHYDPPQLPRDDKDYEWQSLPLPPSIKFEPDFLKKDLLTWLKGEEIFFQTADKAYFR